MSTHLVIGASGQVGEHLVYALHEAGFRVEGTYRSRPVKDAYQLDIRDVSQTRSLMFGLRPTTVYLPAAWANVDDCELNPANSYATNVLGVRNVLKIVNEIGASLVYFSSDYIFDGQDGPYSESDAANPICEYGRQKLLAEHMIALQAKNYLIVRTTVVYGWESQGKNFVYRLLRSLESGQTIKVPYDQIGNPTYAPDLARAVIALVSQDARGVYNIVGPDRISRYQFACQAAQIFGFDTSLVIGVSTSELGQRARRPLNAGLRVDKLEAEYNLRLSSHIEGLKKMAFERRLRPL